jgi:tight adherence protein B
MRAVLLLLAVLAVTLAILGGRNILAGSGIRSLAATEDATERRRARAERVRRLDQRLARTRPGALVERQISSAGVPVGVSMMFGLSLGAVLVGFLLASSVLPAPIALVVAVATGFAPFAELRRRRQARYERFVGQLPELARVMSSAASAGLALRSALALAAEELAEPAGEELRRVVDGLAVGRSLADALAEMEQRIPSRELAVLTSTLVISARAGGSVVTALNNIALTLDSRKELRREVRTLLAQAVASSYLVLAIGLGVLLVLAIVSPKTLNAMAGAGPGQLALLIALAFFLTGFTLIRRMTRISL